MVSKKRLCLKLTRLNLYCDFLDEQDIAPVKNPD